MPWLNVDFRGDLNARAKALVPQKQQLYACAFATVLLWEVKGRVGEGEARGHDADGVGALVDEEEAAVGFGGGDAGGAGAGEEVEDGVAFVRVDLDDAVEEFEGLLGGVAGLFPAVGGDDGAPPDVGRDLAAGGFFGADEVGGHVGDAVDGFVVEDVVFGVFGVPEDVVVLGGPAAFWACRRSRRPR